ncbi:MAG TPA: ABC transporter ATP-binding protein [Anaerolineaceae bacterium]
MNISLRAYWELLSRHIRPQRGRFALLSVLIFTSIGLQVVNPQIMRYFIDTALAGGALQHLMIAAAGFITIALVQQAVSVSVTYLGENVAWTATNALRAELADHCLNLDMGFHNNHTPGELIERIDGDVTELANFFSQFMVMLAGNSLLLVGILIALFAENWKIGLAFALFAVVTLSALNRVRNISVVHQKAFRQATADMYGYVEEQLAATEDVRSSGAVDYSLRELHRLQGDIMRHDYKSGYRNWIINIVTGTMMALGMILVMTSGYLLYTASAITIGTVYLFIHYIELLDQPFWRLTRQVQEFQTIGACVERLTELRKIQPRVEDVPADKEITAPIAVRQPGSGQKQLALRFENVSFSYNSDDLILENLSFQVQNGAVLGLLGRTGSGKTTLSRLVFRLYDPTAGHIWVNDRNIREMGLQALRKRIGLVTQEVQLFQASVRDNLTFFDRTISDRQIINVFQELDLGSWFGSLSNGLDTRLASGGHSLSAGEAQLLALARVFLRDPGLVILDEASSRLDPATEQRIERAINKLLAGRTAIVIAHRLATVQRASEIMILEGGKIGEMGKREELASNPNSQFYHLLQTGMQEVLA